VIGEYLGWLALALVILAAPVALVIALVCGGIALREWLNR
jgi:hypothetical protein